MPPHTRGQRRSGSTTASPASWASSWTAPSRSAHATLRPSRCAGEGAVSDGREIAEFAYACLGEKGKQRAMTDELDAKHQSDLYETLQGPDRKVFVSNTAAGAGRPLTDPQVHADDRGFSTYLRERLLVRVLPEGQKCVCGADASNEHVHTCTRLQQNPRTTRHDMINMTFANGLRLCGFQCGMEPRLTEASRRRPDILIVGLDTYAITDVTVTYAGRVTAYVSEESMEEADPLRAARDRLTQKTTKVPSLGPGQRAGL
ncbi:putative SLACS reverse transcriptase [Trypanosoma cruzi]|uniref:Putative SLACS reverse transcriptase n=1 Tax=Trypanosoma cruzi TaxID=5693 RepID=A0A2V2UG44_TRYCR|nr:putative SLACS reverse transcriptase [Trypanosoma cruzi]